MNDIKEAVEITDLNIKYVSLSSGTYLIDNEVVKVDGYKDKKTQVKDINNIRYISTTSIKNRYVDNYLNEMSIEEYNNKYKELTEKADWDEYEECYKWKSLEDEFEYKKLTTYWKPIYTTVQTLSDPILVQEVKKIVYDTGNKYITNALFSGFENRNVAIYTYNLPKARVDIVHKIFKEIGFEYKGKISYGATEGNKIWGNSDHSVIQYVTAFGTYLFGEWGKTMRCPIGTLEDMQKRYDEDYEIIRKTIMNKYMQHYGKINENTFDFKGLLNTLYNLQSYIYKIDTKAKTKFEKEQSIFLINKSINTILKSASVED